MHAVLDTSVLVSGLIQPQGPPGRVLRALRDAAFAIVLSEAILLELLDVLSRKQLMEKYHLRIEDTLALVDLLLLRGQAVTPVRRIRACRDPRDDMFLEAAIAGQADVLVSGDADLLALHPFEGLPVLSPAAFLAQLESE